MEVEFGFSAGLDQIFFFQQLTQGDVVTVDLNDYFFHPYYNNIFLS